MMNRHARTAIGVDIGGRTIAAAQLSVSGLRYRLLALCLLPRTEPEKEICPTDAAALHRVLRRQGFRGSRIVVALPPKQLLRATLELPVKVAGAPIRQIVRMELSRLHNTAPDSFEMVHWELKAPDSSKPVTQTLALGCPHEAANAFLDVFEEAGFDVSALDAPGVAALRACAPLLSAPPALTAIVDLGWQSTSMLFVCGSALVYERSLEKAAMSTLSRKLAEAFGIPLHSAHHVINTVGLVSSASTSELDRQTVAAIRRHACGHFDRLVDELKVPLSYANRQFPGAGVQRLLFVGGGAGVPGLGSYLSERLGVEARAVAPSDLVESPDELLGKAGNPATTIAVGLAQFGGGG
jgi:type IV pilus assembly protein PilM